MVVTFLGTGTSEGVPVPRCHCPVCEDGRIRPHGPNHRTRTSIMVRKGDRTLVVDTGPDFKEQMIREGVEEIDAVLYTHPHADHVAGVADLRSFSRRPTLPIPSWQRAVPVYADEAMAGWLRTHAGYIEHAPYPIASIHPVPWFRPQRIAGFTVVPLPVWHGRAAGWISGYLVDDLAYLTDVKGIPGSPFGDPDIPMPEEVPGDTWRYLLDHTPRVLVLDCLEHRHRNADGKWGYSPSHLTVEEVLAMIGAIGAERTYGIHYDHALGWKELEGYRKQGLLPSYDGLKVEV